MRMHSLVMAVIAAIHAPSPLTAQDKRAEPAPEQVRRVNDAFARVGATEEHSVDPHSGRAEYRFRLPADTTDADLAKLPTSPFPFGLVLAHTKVTARGLRELKGLDTLDYLRLSEAQLTDEALAALQFAGLLHALAQATGPDGARPRGPKDVAGLDLRARDARITARGLRHLRDLTSLTYLELTEDQTTDVALRALREIGLLHALSSATAAGDRRPRGPKDVIRLELGPKVTDAGLPELKDLTNLEVLRLDRAAVTGAGLKGLRGLDRLNHVWLAPEQVTDEALSALRQAGLLHALGQAAAEDGKRPTNFGEVTSLDLNGTKVGDAGIKAVKDLPRLATLHLGGTRVTNTGVKDLAGLAALTDLRLGSTRVTGDAVQDLASLTNLTTLGLPHNALTAAQLRQLKGLKKLTTLDCGRLSDEKMRALREIGLLHSVTQATNADSRAARVGRPRGPEDVIRFSLWNEDAVSPEGIKELRDFKNLRELEGTRFGVTDAKLKALREVGLLHALERAARSDGSRPRSADSVHVFEVGVYEHADVTDDGLKELRVLKNLMRLTVRSDEVSGVGLSDLKELKELRTLHLSGSKLTADGLRALRELPALTELTVSRRTLAADEIKEIAGIEKLTALDLSYVRLTADEARELKRLKSVRTLKLTLLGDPGPVLKELQGLDSLTSLTFMEAELADQTVKHLGGLTSLPKLNLSATQLSDAGLKELQALKKLTWLDFYGGRVTRAAIGEFKQAVPKCRLFVDD